MRYESVVLRRISKHRHEEDHRRRGAQLLVKSVDDREVDEPLQVVDLHQIQADDLPEPHHDEADDERLRNPDHEYVWYNRIAVRQVVNVMIEISVMGVKVVCPERANRLFRRARDDRSVMNKTIPVPRHLRLPHVQRARIALIEFSVMEVRSVCLDHVLHEHLHAEYDFSVMNKRRVV